MKKIILGILILQTTPAVFGQSSDLEMSVSHSHRNQELIDGKLFSFDIHQADGIVSKGGSTTTMTVTNNSSQEKHIQFYQNAACRNMYDRSLITWWCMTSGSRIQPGATRTSSFELEKDSKSQWEGLENPATKLLGYDCTIKTSVYETVDGVKTLIKSFPNLYISKRSKVRRCSKEIIAPELLANYENKLFNGVLNTSMADVTDIYDLYPVNMDCNDPVLPFAEALIAFETGQPPETVTPAPTPTEPTPTPTEPTPTEPTSPKKGHGKGGKRK